MGIITSATFYHPSIRGHLVLPSFLFGAKAQTGYTGNPYKDYFVFRNHAYINLHVRDRYAGMKSMIASVFINTTRQL
jgi:hypothetical protein